MIPLLLTTMLACGGPGDDTGGGPPRPLRPIESEFDPPDTVVVIVVDTLARRMLTPWQPDGWDTSPNLAALFDDATLLPDTQATRGLTSVAVSSIASGTYPRIHGVRDNRDWKSPWNPILSEMFQEHGYTTLGYASNTCQFIDRGIDERFCTWSWETDDYDSQAGRDQALITRLSDSLRSHPADEKLFIWLHLINPHDPFVAEPQWYDEFHPDVYDGPLVPSNTDLLDQWILEGRELTEEDKRHLDAVYASQIKELDRQLGDLFATLQEVGRWDDGVILFTADHGEELGEHNNYFFHGCSVYQQTLQVVSAIRAPGRLPRGVRFDTTISATDLAPTLSRITGIGWEGYRDGEDLTDDILAGAITPHPAYFERGLGTAGVVSDHHRYLLDINEGTDECKPYEIGGRFVNDYEELYDQDLDPGEQTNLAGDDPDTLAALRDLTCTWVTSDVWYSPSADRTHPMVTTCEDVLGIVEPDAASSGCATAPGRRAPWAPLLAALGLLATTRRRPRPRVPEPPLSPSTPAGSAIPGWPRRWA
ncbi:MAG: hypothetical protein D6798_20370 [Deltaproteobacteria bacterium]|nr:MAG: hypothetical protein D6798_20370 [Deltaproteobacteria bacterium]